MTRWLFVLVGLCACGSNAKPGADGGNGNDAQAADGQTASVDSGSNACASITATIRDFHQSHPDFETFSGSDAFPGIVETVLGSDNKPVYAHAGGTAQTTGPAEFAQWYNDVPNVNQPFAIPIPLTEQSPGVLVYDNDAFFPIDNQGFGNEGNDHNFHFTTEIHTQFTYKGGETFTFTGDDDLWMFVNHRLAIDLGGLHPSLTQSVDFDARASELGLQLGQTYPMDIFHAERHTVESHFRVETTIDCFVVP